MAARRAAPRDGLLLTRRFLPVTAPCRPRAHLALRPAGMSREESTGSGWAPTADEREVAPRSVDTVYEAGSVRVLGRAWQVPAPGPVARDRRLPTGRPPVVSGRSGSTRHQVVPPRDLAPVGPVEPRVDRPPCPGPRDVGGRRTAVHHVQSSRAPGAKGSVPQPWVAVAAGRRPAAPSGWVPPAGWQCSSYTPSAPGPRCPTVTVSRWAGSPASGGAAAAPARRGSGRRPVGARWRPGRRTAGRGRDGGEGETRSMRTPVDVGRAAEPTAPSPTNAPHAAALRRTAEALPCRPPA